ncbi:UDP-GlcNAc:undecaprenyl-phosphate GlcNAc-1-phosphate transferase [Thermoleophilum album]|uniref:UDP-GlcNAc:undecaprenyl-phosphate GlcNAc-1-phosphate transferase n=1 Tax=Thermoleophilum album TaxID=29539 RepID=A0A1H6FHL5_THEAL|nr:MraY family glycosyltransferase [Thermoleophilum album]SEH10327.1 UDP-GlcNAc:undecaprenyl-phosphate GlcNAc-1-phosphate transferase [Thermoleophilum album]
MGVRDAVGAFALAAVVAWLATPLSARLARRLGVIHVPRERDLHERPTPGLGGLAILAAVIAAGLVFLPLQREYLGVLAGAALIALLGALDDRFDLHPVPKLMGQLAAASVPVAAGVYVDHVTLPFLGALDLGPAGPPLTLLGIVAVVNVVNWTDGVDGLAAGVCLIAAVTFAVLALSLDRDAAGVLAALTAGAAAGFLRHNFHPASVFMGDAGSNLLGLLLACVAIQGVLKTAAVVALLFPLMVLAVPAADATFVIAKRIKYRRPVYAPDRWHFHHRFANIGFSQRRTVMYLYGWSLSLALLALALRFVPYSDEAGHLRPGWAALLAVFGAIAVAASVYVVYVLEILKFRRWRERDIQRRVETGELPALSREAIEREIEREIETGEFEAVRGEPGS